MIKVHILHEPYYSQNGVAFVFPLNYNRQRLREHGVALHFFSAIRPPLLECDVLCLSSKFFSTWWGEDKQEQLFAFLEQARKSVKKIIWFDFSDSTGTTHFRVLPYVDSYCKNQILKNKNDYQKKYYGSRIFTDFYHQQFGIDDQDPGSPPLNHIPIDEDLKKIIVGWNSGLFNYGYYGLMLGAIWQKAHWLPQWYARKWSAPSSNRPIVLSCRIGTAYTRKTIAFSREKIKQLLQSKVIANKISRRDYFKEMRQSISAVSPFGLGEISLRDFELTVCGTAMIKQDMSHLETWPNLWIKEKSYLDFAWDFSDFQEKIDYAIQNPQDMVELAHQAQKRYKNLLTTEQGHEEFCQRFVNIISI